MTGTPWHAVRSAPVLLALIMVIGATRQAQAQSGGSTSPAEAADTSWFAQYHPAPVDTLLPSAYEGWKQFQLNCSRCHGQDAEGTTVAPSLVQALAKGGPVPSEEVFLRIACDGVPGTAMPSWCKQGLGMTNLREIYLYVSGRANGTIHPGRPTMRDNTSL